MRRGNSSAPKLAETPPLTIQAGDGQARLVFPGEVIHPLRHMVTALGQRGELPARISVISAIREEGVTYMTLALAATIAHDLAARVCAVELNGWWPGMVRLLIGGEQATAFAGPGLAAVLAGQATLDEALLATVMPDPAGNHSRSGPYVLPAGEMPLEQRPIMARGSAVREVIGQLRERFDYLILDVPAILVTSDAIPLASLGDACCLVICQGVTVGQDVRLALDDVENLRMLGVILNQVRIATPRFLLKRLPQE